MNGKLKSRICDWDVEADEIIATHSGKKYKYVILYSMWCVFGACQDRPDSEDAVVELGLSVT